MDTDKLIKLLNLSQSPNDSEALSAIRKANKIIKDDGLRWEDLILSSQKNVKNNEMVSTRDKVDDLMKCIDEMSIAEKDMVFRASNALFRKKRVSPTLLAQIEFLYKQYCSSN